VFAKTIERTHDGRVGVFISTGWFQQLAQACNALLNKNKNLHKKNSVAR